MMYLIGTEERIAEFAELNRIPRFEHEYRNALEGVTGMYNDSGDDSHTLIVDIANELYTLSTADWSTVWEYGTYEEALEAYEVAELLF